MKTAREYWGLADDVAGRIRANQKFDMKMVSWPCGTPACIAGEVCAAVGRVDLLEMKGGLAGVGEALRLAPQELGVPQHLFDSMLMGWDEDLVSRYRNGDRQGAAVEALYREIERAHGPRPADEVPVYTVPDWKRVVREMELEEAGVGG